jgi:hypothetical protein
MLKDTYQESYITEYTSTRRHVAATSYSDTHSSFQALPIAACVHSRLLEPLS